MLNTVLVQQFQEIHRERKSGVMTVTITANNKLRYCFKDGELELLDLGEDKERLMARKFLDYHKIGPEIHRHTLDSCQVSGKSIVETLRRQQLVNDSEIQQIARVMVEDLLVLCFGVPHQQAVFSEVDGADSFNLEGTAVRLSIQTDVMLRMVDTRIKDEEEIHRALGGWNAKFSVTDGAEASEPLDDFERHVLNFVDGRKTVDDIAIGFRDSSLNMARILLGLERKGYLQRAAPGGASTGKRAAVKADGTPAEPTPRAGAPVQAYMPPVPGPQRNFVQPKPAFTLNRNMTVVLAVVLVMMVLVSWLVHRADVHQAHMSRLNGQLGQAASQHKWKDGQAAVDEAAQMAADGEIDSRDATAIREKFEQLLEDERAAINQSIADGDFAQARDLIDMLPDPAEVDRLHGQANDEEDAMERQSEALRKQVAALIDAGDMAGCLAVLDKAHARDARQANEYLERWRISRLEAATAPGTSFTERVTILDLVSQARPTSLQQEQINNLKGELRKGEARHLEQIRHVRRLVDEGNIGEAEAEIERLRLLDSQPGAVLKGDLGELKVRIEKIRGEMKGAEDAGMQALGRGDRNDLVAAQGKIKSVLERYKGGANRATLESLLSAIDTIAPLAGSGSLNDEIALLKTLLTDQASDNGISQIIGPRIAGLAELEAAAQGSLDYIRKLERDGRWDEVESRIEDLRAHREWRRTSAGLIADQEAALVKAAKAKREERQKKFDQALAAHDVATAYALANELGLNYLPMVVESTPPGAHVWKGAENMGATPLIIKVDAGDRLDLALEVKLDGYETAKLAGADAKEGWHLAVLLKRKALVNVDLNMLVTNAPAAADGKIWIAGNKQIASIGLDGKKDVYPYEKGADAGASSLSEPVYAPVVRLDDGVFLITRDHTAFKVTNNAVERVTVAAPSSYALAGFHSPFQVNRRYLIVAGLDGVLHGMDDRDASAHWESKPGAKFICAPAVVGESVLVARENGVLQSYQADNGKLLKTVDLRQPVVAAWAAEGGLGGFTPTAAWSWAGGEIQSAEVPREPVTGNDGIFTTIDRHVYIRAAASPEWQDAGQYSGDISGEPLLWHDRAVVPTNGKAYVMGPKGFTVTSPALFMTPAKIGDNLALVDSAGRVAIYAP